VISVHLQRLRDGVISHGIVVYVQEIGRLSRRHGRHRARQIDCTRTSYTWRVPELAIPGCGHGDRQG
jgi:hypothetical protein